MPVQQEIKYIPGVLQTLKFAWIQYLSLALPAVGVFYVVVGFVFRHRIVDTAVSSDLMTRRKI